MPEPAVIVLVIDRLGAGMLGPYGNTWIDTPNFNRVASQSLVCENAIADSPSLEQAYRAYMLGEHALASTAGRELWQAWRTKVEPTQETLSVEPVASQLAHRPAFGALAAAAGVRTVLLTDNPAVADFETVRDFAEHIVLPLPAATTAAADIAETSLANLFEAAADALRQMKPPFVLWIHAHGMAGPWDAPLNLRNQFADEDDPTPPTFVAPPEMHMPAGFDPDALLGFSHAYGGQVSLLDLCLGMLLDEIDQQPWAAQASLTVTSPRGYPLGQHGRVGPCDDALFGELLHVPLSVRLPHGQSTLERRRHLVQPTHLHATLLELTGLQASTDQQTEPSLLALLNDTWNSHGQVACSLGPGQRLIRTPAWSMRQSLMGDELRHDLFCKPDDFWEVNEISSRGTAIVALLAAELERRQAAFLTTGIAQAAPLAEPLTNLWR